MPMHEDFFDGSFLDSGALDAGLPDRSNVRGLILREGVATLEQIASASFDLGGGLDCIDLDCRLEVPLLVSSDASLLIEGTSRSPFRLRMVREGVAFLGNAGELWVDHAEIVGWDATIRGPALDASRYRPFILAVEGSRTTIRDSLISHLGYDESTAYGLTLSVAERTRSRDLPAPTGALLRNQLQGLFYAFYSHEASDVQLIGNQVRASHKYGIDPHDDSRRMLIARNDIANTGVVPAPNKPPGGHGIIVSRRVVDSWIISNRSIDNARSGIVIDKKSDRIVVSENLAARNTDDGITVYESDDLWIGGNVVTSNGDSGIRVRDSANLVIANNQIGPHPAYCIKTTHQRKNQIRTRLAIHNNNCHSGSRLLRVEGIAELSLIAPAFRSGPDEEPDWSRPRLNGPEPWREVLLNALHDNRSAKFLPVLEPNSQHR